MRYSFGTHTDIFLLRYISPLSSPNFTREASLRHMLLWVFTTWIPARLSRRHIASYIACWCSISLCFAESFSYFEIWPIDPQLSDLPQRKSAIQLIAPSIFVMDFVYWTTRNLPCIFRNFDIPDQVMLLVLSNSFVSYIGAIVLRPSEHNEKPYFETPSLKIPLSVSRTPSRHFVDASCT